MSPTSVKGIKSFSGEIRLPLDKSIAQRAFILDLPINEGILGEDILSTKRAAMKSRLNNDYSDLYLGNSGTGIRLLTGFLSGSGKHFSLSGDQSLNSRPMSRIADPLNEMGAEISLNDGKAPINIAPASLVNSFAYQLPVASAQLKSALLLAALNSKTKIKIEEPVHTRNHTELMLAYLGADLSIHKTDRSNVIELNAVNGYKKKTIYVPGDFSSASFFIALGLLGLDSKLIIPNAGINPTRIAFLKVLIDMGANIEISNRRKENNEEIADLIIQSSQLRMGNIPNDLVPNLIDEIPILSILAAFSEGVLRLENIGELRVKESNRIHAIEQLLSVIGVEVKQEGDDLEISGAGSDFVFKGGEFKSFGDHRIAMCAAISAVRSSDEVFIDDIQNVRTSFPNFFTNLEHLGFKISNNGTNSLD